MGASASGETGTGASASGAEKTGMSGPGEAGALIGPQGGGKDEDLGADGQDELASPDSHDERASVPAASRPAAAGGTRQLLRRVVSRRGPLWRPALFIVVVGVTYFSLLAVLDTAVTP